MIAAYRDAVIVAHLVVDEVLLDIAHHLHRELGREDTGILRLVFLQDIRLHRPANRRERPFLDLGVDFRGHELVTGNSQQSKAEAVVPRRQLADVFGPQLAFEICVDFLLRRFPLTGFPQMFFHLLIDRRIHEESEDHRCGPVDRHGDRRRRFAKVEAGIKLLHVIDGGD